MRLIDADWVLAHIKPIDVDENTPNLLSFEKLKDAVQNDMETAVKDMLCEEFGDIATVKVTKTFADLYRTEVT